MEELQSGAGIIPEGLPLGQALCLRYIRSHEANDIRARTMNGAREP